MVRIWRWAWIYIRRGERGPVWFVHTSSFCAWIHVHTWKRSPPRPTFSWRDHRHVVAAFREDLLLLPADVTA